MLYSFVFFVGLIVGVIVAGVVLIAVFVIIACKIRLEYLYALLRGEVWAYTTSLSLWYVQTLLNLATFY